MTIRNPAASGVAGAWLNGASKLALRILGLGLMADLLLFPVIKAGGDRSMLVAGYLAIAVAGLALVVAARPFCLGRIESSLAGLRQERIVVILFVAALLLRLSGMAAFRIEVFGDYALNELRAWNVSQGLGDTNGRFPISHYPPGYVYFLAGFYALVGRMPVLLKLLNCGNDAFNAVLVYRLAQCLWNERKARLAGLLYVVNPVLLICSQQLIYAPLLAMLLLLLCLVVNRGAVLIGVILGLTALVKPIVLPAPLLVAAVNLASGWRPGRVVKRLVLVALVMACTIAPWTLRNYLTFDRFLLVSANGGWVLWWSNNPHADGQMPPWTEEQRAASGAAIIDLDKRLGQEAVVWIGEHPGTFIGLIPRRQAYTWGTEIGTLPDLQVDNFSVVQLVRGVVQVFYIALALAAAMTLLRHAPLLSGVPQLHMAAMLVLLAWLIHSVYIGWSFYHQPFLPFLTVFAAGYYGGGESAAKRRGTGP